MPDNFEAQVATADALTQLLHNQHVVCAAIEGATKWLSENGVESIAANSIAAMEALDANAQSITDAIMRLRQLEASSNAPLPLPSLPEVGKLAEEGKKRVR